MTTALTEQQVAAVFTRIDSTGRAGASHHQINTFVALVLGAAGSRVGYDDPTMSERITAGTAQVLEQGQARGYRRWSTGSGSYTVQRVGRA